MKKQTSILALGLTFAALMLSGCGDNFAALEIEFVKNNDSLSRQLSRGPFFTEPCSKCHPAYDEMLKLKPIVDKQWTELEEIAKSDRDAASRLIQLKSDRNDVVRRYAVLMREIPKHRNSRNCNYGK